MNTTTSKPLAICLAAAAIIAPAAPAAVIGDAGQANPPDRGLAERSSALNQRYGLDGSTARTPPPISRMDGTSVTSPQAGTGAVAVTPPDRIDGSQPTSVDIAHVTPPDRIDATSPATPRPIVVDGGGDFDWTAAGLGFAAAAGLALLGTGTLLTTRWRRNTGPLAH